MSDRRTTHFRKSVSAQKSRHGFTLVELMVAIVLVVILLLMYATVFEQATSAITIQKAIGKNDERSRMLSIVMKDDLNRRTFRTVIPFDPNQIISSNPVPDWPNLKGYFSISENDPANNTDDVLSLTIQDGKSLYFGRATFLTESTLSPNPLPTLYIDQLEGDDGLIPLGEDTDGDGIFDQAFLNNLNQLGASTSAEVVYFLRNGTLYRRIQLIRDPYASIVLDPPMITGDFSDANILTGFKQNGSFWNYFDYSAHYNPFEVPGKVRFHGVGGYLTNEPGQSPTFPVDIKDTFGTVISTETWPRSAGNPYQRFGSSLGKVDDVVDVANGEIIGDFSDPRPTEYITSPDPNGDGNTIDSITSFIGRYTMQETSNSVFGYPGRIPAAGDPHSRFFTGIPVSNGVVSAYSGQTLRRGEDILLTNVHSFDIKVWDDGLAVPRFVNLGHNLGTLANPGYYSQTNASTTSKFHNPAQQQFRYDTWTPFVSPHIGSPPFRPTADVNGGGIDSTNGSPDVLRLKAIQITIRFLDEASGKMRQLTIQHALNTKSTN